jgi:signal transduction histidine kinase
MKTKRKSIIVYYALAIVLPCLILGVLAFRGIKNDQALEEREKRRKLHEAGQQIILETEAYLSSVENSFIELIDSVPIPRETICHDSLLFRFYTQNQTIAGVFFLSEDGVPLLLNNGLQFIPDDLLSDPDVEGFKITQDILEKGWQFEFRENDHKKALEYYQSMLAAIADEQSEGAILNAIARVQKKMKLKDDAIATYDLIWLNFPRILIQNKIPLGAVALLEKSLLLLQKKDTVAALKTVYVLMDQFQMPMWEIGYSNYTNFMSKVEQITMLCENSLDEESVYLLQKIHAVQDSLTVLAYHTEYLLNFLDNSAFVLGNEIPDREDQLNRFNTRINGKPYFLSLFQQDINGQWGLIMDLEYILRSTIQPSILENITEANFYWKVSGDNGETLLVSEHVPYDTPPVYAIFPSNLPSLSLTLYPEDPGVLVSLLRPGKGLFFYIFVVIVLILVFGLFFTLHTINQELHLSRMKSNFMSTVSHEFKSPLTSIRQMAEMLVRGRVPTNEKQQKYYNTILQQSERLSHLIDNILDFSKMEEGQKAFRFEKADIAPVVGEIVELFRKHTAEQGFDISLSIPESLPELVFDREAMEQVMHNLLDNACKYSGESRSVEVQLITQGNKVLIGVRDYGIGIRKEDHEKIFSRFYRAGEELSQNVKGSGIGLTIVKQIVEAHQGEIKVVSSPGKGSLFSIIIPVSQK